MEITARNTAYKVWIGDLISNIYSRGSEQFDAGYVSIKGNKVSRVNLIGSVIDKFSGDNYVSVSLDDGSGVVMLKAWSEAVTLFLDVDIGDLVLIIGKVKNYNNSTYVTPEIIKKLDNPLWLKVRKLELTKLYGETTRIEFQNITNNETSDEEGTMNIVEEKISNEEVNSREIVLGLVEALDSGEGADIENVVKSSKLGDEAKSVLEELIKEGEIFELHTGKLRITG